MTGPINNNPIILASNDVSPRPLQKQPDPQNFEIYLADSSAVTAAAKKPEEKPVNAMQTGASALSSYMQQLENISNGGQAY